MVFWVTFWKSFCGLAQVVGVHDDVGGPIERGLLGGRFVPGCGVFILGGVRDRAWAF